MVLDAHFTTMHFVGHYYNVLQFWLLFVSNSNAKLFQGCSQVRHQIKRSHSVHSVPILLDHHHRRVANS